MDIFKTALAKTLKHEGVYSNDSCDSGGKTKFGITEAVARGYGYSDVMSAMPMYVAEGIYREYYWDKIRLDDVARYNAEIAIELFDTGVNMGVGRAGKFLQRAINCLNRTQTMFDDLKVDGIVGSQTIRALNKLTKMLDPLYIVTMLNALQGAEYIRICEQKPDQERFIRGWLTRVN